MADNTHITAHELGVEGRQMSLTATKTDPTTLNLTWKIPANARAYNGAVVLVSETRFGAEQFPVDGTRYVASSNISAPADQVGGAQVVAAFYGFFNDDVTQTSVTVTNLDPAKIYYASIHAASNVLQYYAVGTQSYPLEQSRNDTRTETYAGSIPSSATPPANPVNGQAYFDQATNSVLVWNDAMDAWVKSNQKTVPVGRLAPINTAQIFYNAHDQALKFFDGSAWVNSTPLNTRVKMGAAWSAYSGTTYTSALYPSAPAQGDFAFISVKGMVSAPATTKLELFSLGTWFAPTADLVQVDIAGTWTPVVIADLSTGTIDPAIPAVGDFFYRQSTRDLLVWDGVSWSKADTEEEGTATSDKLGVGTDGSYDDRLRLIKILKHQLGWPQVCVELSEEQFNVAIDNALDEIRRRADNAYSHRHVSFTIKRGQSSYYLNDPRDKTNRIVNVLKIHRVNLLGASQLSGDNGVYAQAFYNQLYQGSNVDLVSIHLMHQLSETFEKIFAGNLSFTWDEASRELLVLRRINLEEERVILEVVMERTEQELLQDRWLKQWIQGWAQAELWEMLGEIRSKYGNLPGANGGVTLNGESLLARAESQMTELLRQIADYEVGNGGVNFGNTAFMIG